MPPRSYNLNLPSNPFLQALYFVLGGVLLIGAVLMGAILLAVGLGVAIVLAIVIYARVWWLSRRQGKSPGRTTGRTSEVLEVEYTVVDERDPGDEPGSRR